MKKIIYKNALFALLVTALVLVLTGCTKNSVDPPVITAVRNYVPSPGDSLLSKAGSGQWVVITGDHLKGTLQILFDGINANFNEALFSENNAVVLIPTIPYNNVPADKVNTIRYVTTHGEATFTFSLVPPAPTITSVSNENAVAGDSVTIFGSNFFYIKSINYGGAAVSVFKASDNGTSVGIKIPAGLDVNQPGPLVLTTQSGTATTVYPVNISTGSFVLFNFNGIGTLASDQNNAPIENNPVLFPGNRGSYMRMNPGIVPANDFGYRNGKRLLFSVPTPWIPAANMNDPVDSWALKFEIFCFKPFSNGVFYIEPSTGSWYYVYRFEPWKTTPNFKPNGWATITIPFNEFRLPLNGANGMGAQATTIKDILVTNIQSSGAVMRFNLCGSTLPVDVDLAIDNVRCVKIK